MALAEIKPMHGESLYDRDGNLVGKWNGERGMFSDCFVVRERACKWLGIKTVEPGEYRCDLTDHMTTLDDYCSRAEIQKLQEWIHAL